MTLPSGAAEIIRRKKLQYCRFADTNQWHEFDKIMLPEATMKFVDSSGSLVVEGGVPFNFSSREEWKTFFSKAFETQQTIHVIGEGEMEQVGPDEIKAIWGVMYQAGTKGTTDGIHGTGGGHYHETWKRKGDDWFMATMWMQRLFWKVASI